jgi:hypothetical protein
MRAAELPEHLPQLLAGKRKQLRRDSHHPLPLSRLPLLLLDATLLAGVKLCYSLVELFGEKHQNSGW